MVGPASMASGRREWLARIRGSDAGWGRHFNLLRQRSQAPPGAPQPAADLSRLGEQPPGAEEGGKGRGRLGQLLRTAVTLLVTRIRDEGKPGRTQ